VTSSARVMDGSMAVGIVVFTRLLRAADQLARFF